MPEDVKSPQDHPTTRSTTGDPDAPGSTQPAPSLNDLKQRVSEDLNQARDAVSESKATVMTIRLVFRRTLGSVLRFQDQSGVSRMRVLIVEDELEIAVVIEDVALKLGFDVIGLAKNAAEAIQMAGDADIAVVDVRLADGLSGPQIAQELVSRYGVGVVFLTGNPELVATDLRISVVTKSPDPGAIAKALSDAAASRRSRSNLRS